MSTIHKDNQRDRWHYAQRARLWLFSLMVTMLLAACGGGGGGTGGGFTAPDPIQVSFNPLTTTVEAFGPGVQRVVDVDLPTTIQVNVRVVNDNGSPVLDGSVVNLISSDVELASVSALDDPDTTDINEFTGIFGQINAETSGGNATFFVTGGAATGTVTLTASSQDPFSRSNITSTIQINVIPNSNPPPPPPPDEGRIELTLDRSTLPANAAGILPFFGSPFIAEATVNLFGSTGALLQPMGNSFEVTISPVGVAAFSTLDDPSTMEDEFSGLLGTGPVDAIGGRATFFVHAFDNPGVATVTVSAVNPETQERVSTSMQVTVVATAATGLPASASITPGATPVFIQNSGGNTNSVLSLSVLDGADQPVNDPEGGGNRFNNVRVTLSPPNANGSFLSATNANGQNVTGTDISLATTGGIAQVGFNSGSSSGLHQITIMADRADNNVDNGIQDLLTVSNTINVGDGRLFSLEIDSPVINAIIANAVSDEVATDNMGNGEFTIPPDPDATYQLTISATANDVTGNPVIEGTLIDIGKVDAPLDPLNGALFNFSGIDGNPVEGGILFTVETIGDGFLDGPDIDEAVEPGDTLLTLGDLIPGNRELESVRTVNNVPTDMILNVSQPFNNNDPSGVITDDGPVIPYIVGRSVIGTLTDSVMTEFDGVGDEIVLTFPTSAVGRPVALYVQGNRTENGVVQTVADIVLFNFPGIAPATLSVSPNSIPGNAITPITLCAADMLGVPLQNLPISFNTISGPGNFDVSNDPLVTGPDGCVTTDAISSGLTIGQEEMVVQFTGAAATADLTVNPPDTAFISAEPSILTITSLSARRVIARVVDADNQPAPNVIVMAECEQPADISPSEGSTNQDGEAEFVVSTSAQSTGQIVTGTCTFTVDLDGNMISTSIIFSIPAVPPSPGP